MDYNYERECMLKNIQYLVLITDNFERSKKFYTEVLGFSIDHEVPEDEYIQFKLENTILAVFSRKEMLKVLDKKYLSKPGGALYTFSEVEDVDQTIKDLKAKGVNIIKEPKDQPWGQRTAYFTDPDGHIWEIQKWKKNKKSV